jgi:glycine cleavage system aminomethyltransferase T
VARKLVSLSLPEATPDRLPPAGTALRSANRDVGRITSVAWSPRLGHGVALGYARRDFVGPGTEFTTSAGRAVVRE